MGFLLLMINAVLFISKTAPSSADLIEELYEGSKIISFHSLENWTNAVKVCDDRDEKLATIDDLNNMDSTVWTRHNLTDTELWTSNTFIHTPFITKTGCFQGEDNLTISADLRVYGHSPVAVCYAYCIENTKFALYGPYCVCNPPRNFDFHRNKDMGNIDKRKRLELFDVSSIKQESYKISEDIRIIISLCRKDSEGRPFVLNESKLQSEMTTKKHAVCLGSKEPSDIELLPGEYHDWESVDKACLNLTGQPVATYLHKSHCESLEKDIKDVFLGVSFLTGKRTYHSEISARDISASGIPFNHILCKTFTWNGTLNLTEGNSSKVVRCNDGKKNFICIKGIHEEAMRTSYVLIVITLVASLLTIVVCTFMFMKCYKRKNEKNEGKPSARTTSDEQYNHTVSNGRISTATENKADKGESEDSEADSDFSSDCVNSESETLNKGNVTLRLQLQISDDSCNYSYASACEHTPLKDIPVGDVILCLNYANKPEIEILPDKEEAEYLNI